VRAPRAEPGEGPSKEAREGGCFNHHVVARGATSVASFLAAALTEIYLCNGCSCQEILRRNGRAARHCSHRRRGQRPGGGGAGERGRALCLQVRRPGVRNGELRPRFRSRSQSALRNAGTRAPRSCWPTPGSALLSVRHWLFVAGAAVVVPRGGACVLVLVTKVALRKKRPGQTSPRPASQAGCSRPRPLCAPPPSPHPLPPAPAMVRVPVKIMGLIINNKNWLRFPYDSTFLRPHYLHPHSYAGDTCARLDTETFHAVAVELLVWETTTRECVREMRP
jgi:hypothetical protein